MPVTSNTQGTSALTQKMVFMCALISRMGKRIREFNDCPEPPRLPKDLQGSFKKGGKVSLELADRQQAQEKKIDIELTETVTLPLPPDVINDTVIDEVSSDDRHNRNGAADALMEIMEQGIVEQQVQSINNIELGPFINAKGLAEVSKLGLAVDMVDSEKRLLAAKNAYGQLTSARLAAANTMLAGYGMGNGGNLRLYADCFGLAYLSYSYARPNQLENGSHVNVYLPQGLQSCEIWRPYEHQVGAWGKADGTTELKIHTAVQDTPHATRVTANNQTSTIKLKGFKQANGTDIAADGVKVLSKGDIIFIVGVSPAVNNAEGKEVGKESHEILFSQVVEEDVVTTAAVQSSTAGFDVKIRPGLTFTGGFRNAVTSHTMPNDNPTYVPADTRVYVVGAPGTKRKEYYASRGGSFALAALPLEVPPDLAFEQEMFLARSMGLGVTLSKDGSPSNPTGYKRLDTVWGQSPIHPQYNAVRIPVDLNHPLVM